MKGQIVWGLVGHIKDLGFHSDGMGTIEEHEAEVWRQNYRAHGQEWETG